MKNQYAAVQALILVTFILVIGACLPISPLNPSNPARYCLWNFTSHEIIVRTDKHSDPKNISPGKYLILDVGARELSVMALPDIKHNYNLPEYVVGSLTIRRGKPCMDVGLTDKWTIHELRMKTYDPKTKESTFEVGDTVVEVKP